MYTLRDLHIDAATSAEFRHSIQNVHGCGDTSAVLTSPNSPINTVGGLVHAGRPVFLFMSRWDGALYECYKSQGIYCDVRAATSSGTGIHYGEALPRCCASGLHNVDVKLLISEAYMQQIYQRPDPIGRSEVRGKPSMDNELSEPGR